MLLRLHIKQLPVVDGMSRSPCTAFRRGCVPIQPSRAVPCATGTVPVPAPTDRTWSLIFPPHPALPPGAAPRRSPMQGCFFCFGRGFPSNKVSAEAHPAAARPGRPRGTVLPGCGLPRARRLPRCRRRRVRLPARLTPAHSGGRSLHAPPPRLPGGLRAARRAQPPPGDAPRRLLLRAGPERRRLDGAGAHGGGRGQAGDLRPAGAGWSSPSPARPPAAAGRDGAGAGRDAG